MKKPKAKPEHTRPIFGPPGIGKTALIKKIALREGIKFRTIKVPDVRPSDLRGVLVLRKKRPR